MATQLEGFWEIPHILQHILEKKGPFLLILGSLRMSELLAAEYSFKDFLLQ